MYPWCTWDFTHLKIIFYLFLFLTLTLTLSGQLHNLYSYYMYRTYMYYIHVCTPSPTTRPHRWRTFLVNGSGIPSTFVRFQSLQWKLLARCRTMIVCNGSGQQRRESLTRWKNLNLWIYHNQDRLPLRWPFFQHPIVISTIDIDSDVKRIHSSTMQFYSVLKNDRRTTFQRLTMQQEHVQCIENLDEHARNTLLNVHRMAF